MSETIKAYRASDETIVHEWRVTGQPQSMHGTDFPPYSFTWRSNEMYDSRSRREGERTLTAEEAARRFAAHMDGWEDGPHLHHRVVTYGPWHDETAPHPEG